MQFSKVKNVEKHCRRSLYTGYNWAKYFERCNSVYFEGRAKRARDVYWAKYNGDSPDDPDNPDNPDDPVTKKYTSNMYSMMGKIAMPIHRLNKITTETITLKKAKKKRLYI